MDDINRDTFAVHAALKTCNGFETTGALANLPADTGCELVESNSVVRPSDESSSMSGR